MSVSQRINVADMVHFKKACVELSCDGKKVVCNVNDHKWVEAAKEFLAQVCVEIFKADAVVCFGQGVVKSASFFSKCGIDGICNVVAGFVVDYCNGFARSDVDAFKNVGFVGEVHNQVLNKE